MEQDVQTEALRERGDIATGLYKTYLGGERDQTLADAIDRVIEATTRDADGPCHETRVGRLAEGKILALVGRSGAGKTRALERVFSRRSELVGYDDVDADSALVSIKAPSPCTLKQLGFELLKALGYPVGRDMKEYVAWELVRDRLELRKVRFVHIDELQHVTAKANVKEAQKVRDTIKGLVQWPQWPVSLILSGTPEIGSFIEEDTQVKRRCLVVHFSSLDVEEDAGRIGTCLRKLVERKAGLAIRGDEHTLAQRIIHAAERQYGTAIEFIQDAIMEALRDASDVVDTGHFARVYKMRTGCGDDTNVFTSRDWRDVTVGSALQEAMSVLPCDKPVRKPKVERPR